MDNYKGYLMKIGDVIFNDPSPKKDSWKFAPALVQVGDSSVVASGKLKIKVLPHDRSKIWVEFPPMTPAKFRRYWRALHSDSGGHGMYLPIEVYDESTGNYINDIFYHSDLQYTTAYLGGERMVILEPFELIGH